MNINCTIQKFIDVPMGREAYPQPHTPHSWPAAATASSTQKKYAPEMIQTIFHLSIIFHGTWVYPHPPGIAYNRTLEAIRTLRILPHIAVWAERAAA